MKIVAGASGGVDVLQEEIELNCSTGGGHPKVWLYCVVAYCKECIGVFVRNSWNHDYIVAILPVGEGYPFVVVGMLQQVENSKNLGEVAAG